MAIIIRKSLTPQERAAQENAVAMAQRNLDFLEYVAMMADIEIPTEEDVSNEQEI